MLFVHAFAQGLSLPGCALRRAGLCRFAVGARLPAASALAYTATSDVPACGFCSRSDASACLRHVLLARSARRPWP
eukprot:15462590-Alexandrium_andersonii.AAC.1